MKFLSMVLSVLSIGAYGQRHLSGRVVDAETKIGLANVSIYLPSYLIGTTSNREGRFTISGIPGDDALIQFSHVGYQTTFMHILLQPDSDVEVLLAPSRIQLSEVVVTGAQSQPPRETSFNVAQYSLQEPLATQSLTLTDALAQVPGVSQLSTGPGIAKPVIRGLYGNRIQVNVNGLRFDNQQWQDEHGLGLGDLGVDRVEVIRGPASVLYGSDAMGGVVNIIDEKPAPVDSRERDMNVRLFSNTYGLSLNAGFKKSKTDRWRKVRVGLDSHADYSDGNNDRVLNSRFALYNLKASWGRTRTNGTHVFSVTASHSQFGFVFDSLARKEEDGRLSRSFDGPHHAVSFVQVGSENAFHRGSHHVRVNAGLTSNLRLEDEGGGGISLSMLLNTVSVLAQSTQPAGRTGEWTYGSSGMFQTNTNFGGRIIVPDAINGELSAFAFYKRRTKKWLLEGGARYDFKVIETYATSSLNIAGNDTPGDNILPFTNYYHAGNLSVGSSYDVTKSVTARVNISTGYRPGNLAELSSNGLHEGTLRWEVGLPDAAIEQNLNLEGAVLINSKDFHFSVAIYRNAFRNYLYLAPTGNEYYGFGIYQYEQTNAHLEGGEVSVDWNPLGSFMEWSAAYATVNARKANGEYLPFIPANKLTSAVILHLKPFGQVTNPAIKFGGNYTFDQGHPAEFETPTPDYWLMDAAMAAGWKSMNISFSCQNILGEQYYDHLSRYKYYGIANMGRNFILTINFKL